MRLHRTRFLVEVLRVAASPSVVVAVGGLLLFTLTLHDLIGVLQRNQKAQVAIDLARAQLAAETALAFCAAGGVGSAAQVEVAGLQLSLEHDDRGMVVVRTGDSPGRQVFECADLPGGGPRALANRRVACDRATLESIGGGALLDRYDLPRLDEAAVAAAPRAGSMRGFRRDLSIGLQHLVAGTDGDDFVWVGADTDLADTLRDGVLLVPGHLWIAPGPRALEVQLSRDVVVVVEGNLYLGRSLHVTGPGRLLLVTTLPDRAVVFADRDGSGAWSAGDVLRAGASFGGPVEGQGNAYLGLRGQSEVPQLQAGLVVAGELHRFGDTEVYGPLVLFHGVTDLRRRARPHGLGVGRWAYRPGRECIPGFAVSGPSRPGLLRLRASH